MSYRTWCFTLNNYSEDDERLLGQLYEQGTARYVLFGRESGESGTPHLQGVLTLASPSRRRALSRLIPRAHLEPCRSRDASIEYCKKEGDFVEHGTVRTNQGKRTDLEDAIATLRDSGLDAVRELHPTVYVRYPRGLSSLLVDAPRDPGTPPEVTWIYGGTGVGKTRYVVDREPDLWISGATLKWWDGYMGQSAVCFDDFRGDFCTFHWLLRLLDRYPVRVEVKGGSREFNSPRIYITCPFHPRDVYPTIEDKEQLVRRISRIIHMESNLFNSN